MRSGQPCGNRRKRGYMLIETIVAFAIFSITLVAIYSATSSSARSLKKSEDVAELQLLMQSELNRLSALQNLQPGQIENSDNGKFRILTTVSEIEGHPPQQAQLAIKFTILKMQAFNMSNSTTDRPLHELESIQLSEIK